MCHEDECRPQLPVDSLQLFSEGVAHVSVESRQGLVEEENVGLADDCARHGHALRLAAAQLRRDPAAEPRKPNERKRSLDASGDRFTTRPMVAIRRQSEGDVLLDGQMREKRVPLKNDVEGTPLRTSARDVIPVEKDAPLVDRFQTGQNPKQRRLAAAAWTEQTEEGAGRNHQIDVIDGQHVAEPLRHADELNGSPGHLESGHPAAASMTWSVIRPERR